MEKMKLSTVGISQQSPEGEEKRCLNSELWHACAGPLVCLPTVGTRVVYFPQGHSEQVAASTNKEVEGHIPNYPSLAPQLVCQLHNVTMHADAETDEVYAQMTLQPLTPEEQKDTYFPLEMDVMSKQPTNYFCKTLTASDTSTHGGFSVPRRAAEKVFPPLDFSQQPPAQELIARDLHDAEWKFRHIFRGQPKRHLLTTGWSVFVSAKRLVAGDSVLFIWNEKNQLLLGIRRANRPQTVMPSSVLSSDSMHIGLLAAAAHAASTNSRFTVFYNPRASPCEFVIPLTKYIKAVYHTRVSVGMRFRMLFETEDSSVRRYMGTITGISDFDPVRWPNSHWRSVKVGWDESTAGERQPRVSLWDIEPLTTFPMYPSLFPFRLKRPWHPGPLPLDNKEDELNALMWQRVLSSEQGMHSLNVPSLGTGTWMQQRFEPLHLGNNLNQYQAISASALHDIRSGNFPTQQLLQNHPSFQLLQQVNANPQLQHHEFQHSPSQILSTQAQSLASNQTHSAQYQQLHQPHIEQEKQQAEQTHAYAEAFPISNNLAHQQPKFPSLYEKPVFPESSIQSVPSTVHGILGSSYPEGNVNNIECSQFGQSMIDHQNKQFWGSKITMPQMTGFGSNLLFPSLPDKGCSMVNETSTVTQNPALYGVSKDSSSILCNAVPSLSVNAAVSGTTTDPFGSCFQNSPYGLCQDDSLDSLQSSQETDPQSHTFVKVYKTGAVGRSLEISQFSNYDELRKALGQMFGIEGLLEDPLRSGWQLVFVDRENDILLLGDDPWESFVNNVWYIKILSPEDVHKMGK